MVSRSYRVHVNRFGTSETFLGIHRRLKPASGGIDSAHWRADVNTEVLIVDPDDFTKRIDSLDTEGEIVFIRPNNVTMCVGYLNEPKMTKENFFPNPHGEGTLYKTGDLGMWIAPIGTNGKDYCRCRWCIQRDGDPGTRSTFLSAEGGTGIRAGVLAVVGRKDFQFKIRGQMVNLEHLDAEAKKLPGVMDAGSVAYKGTDGETELFLYVRIDDTVAGVDYVKDMRLREGLAVALPVYAIPKEFGRVHEMPRNANGKLVRRSLPLPKANKTAPTIEQAESPDMAVASTSERVVGIFQRTLQIECGRLSTEDSWIEAGGNSLTGMLIVKRIEELIGVKLKPTQVRAVGTARLCIGVVVYKLHACVVCAAGRNSANSRHHRDGRGEAQFGWSCS